MGETKLARWLSLFVVLSGGFAVYLLLSGAPTRVHVATALGWVPALVGLQAVLWAKHLRPLVRVATGFAVWAGGALLIAALTSVVVVKADFTLMSVLADLLALAVVFCAVSALVLLAARILLKVI
jgi:hypothetical protein